MNHAIDELKKLIPALDNIFIVIKTDDEIILPEKAFKVENGLNAKFLNKKDKNCLVEIRVASQTNQLKIDITNYSVIKLSGKEIKLVNLNNGATYLITQ